MPQPTTAPAVSNAKAAAEQAREAAHGARVRAVLTLANAGILVPEHLSDGTDHVIAEALEALNVKAPAAFRDLKHYADELLNADERARHLDDDQLEALYDEEELSRGIKYHHGRDALRASLVDEADRDLDRLIGASLPEPILGKA